MSGVEIWKDIKGYEELYQISNLGRVKSLSRKVRHVYFGEKVTYKISKERILKLRLVENGKGYFYAKLSNRDRGKLLLVSRLVAKAFIPNPENKPEVNHIDGNPQNNHVNNLEWVTHKENIKHAYDNNLVSISQKQRDNCRKVGLSGKIKVKQLNKDTNEVIKIWESMTKAEQDLKIFHISSCCSGDRKTCGGFKWEKYYE